MSDPVADFLAREQDVLAGIDDPSLVDGVPQLMNNGLNNDEEVVDENVARIEGGDSGVDLSALDGFMNATNRSSTRSSTNPSPSLATVPKIEPEKIRKWREEQKLMLEKKDKNEEQKMSEMRLAGRKELDEWYAHRAERLSKAKTTNRKAEADFIQDRDCAKNGSDWDRIAKLCEFNAKNAKSTTDLSRLRTMLLQLKVQKE